MNEVRKIFQEPLVVIDPVDKGRNLGAAVRASQLWNLVAASRVFSSKPSAAFFFEPKIRSMAAFEFRRHLRIRKSDILCIRMDRINAVVDILWSQLYRTQRALVGLLESNDFVVTKSASWSDEKAFNALVFELESSTIPAIRKHYGPPISKRPESSSFLSKHRENAGTVSGPSIENDRWVVIKRRPFTSAKTLLRSIFRSGGAGVGVAPLLIREFKQRAKVYEGSEVAELVSTNSDFGKFMRTFLDGRPAWFAE
jgi:tRNA nucleotidyltransferase (CCA-adding enzyme)